MSRVFSCTIAQKIASTSPAHTRYTIEKSVRISSRSFSIGPMKPACCCSQVWISTPRSSGRARTPRAKAGLVSTAGRQAA